MKNIKIGTCVHMYNAMENLPGVIDLGFECFEVDFQKDALAYDIEESAKRILELTQPRGIEISCLGLYENTMMNESVRKSFERLIDNAHLFGTDLVVGFTGRDPEKSVPENIAKYKEVFTELSKRAEAAGVRIAFENCLMGGNWERGGNNLAFCPSAWELLFDAVPADNIGLEWEPCHQIYQFVDPITQLRKWAPKIFHLHGKDAEIDLHAVRTLGTHAGAEFFWHRLPGLGACNWADIISILRRNHYEGNIDIEGWHDSVYGGALEVTGQVRCMQYLKECRGGDFIDIPYPPNW